MQSLALLLLLLLSLYYIFYAQLCLYSGISRLKLQITPKLQSDALQVTLQSSTASIHKVRGFLDTEYAPDLFYMPFHVAIKLFVMPQKPHKKINISYKATKYSKKRKISRKDMLTRSNNIRIVEDFMQRHGSEQKRKSRRRKEFERAD